MLPMKPRIYAFLFSGAQSRRFCEPSILAYDLKLPATTESGREYVNPVQIRQAAKHHDTIIFPARNKSRCLSDFPESFPPCAQPRPGFRGRLSAHCGPVPRAVFRPPAIRRVLSPILPGRALEAHRLAEESSV